MPISERQAMREHLMILGFVWLGLGVPLAPTTAQGQTAPAQSDKDTSGYKPDNRKTALRMTPGIVCSAINGYEDYKILPKAAQTCDEKLLVYFRPLGYQTERVDDAYQAHLIPDFQIRKRGEKEVLLQKLKMYEYKVKDQRSPRLLYMKNSISLKGLPPGEYDLTMILHDEIAKGPPAKQVIKFRVIPADLPDKAEKASKASDEPDSQ
jgi:hypothetical protein